MADASSCPSFPVPPEVGKIGKDSPTFIQPVSERSDGIKSFFNKQSPAKPKTEAAEGKPSSLAKDEKPDVEARNYKPDVASLPDLKAEPGHTEMPKVEEGIKSELPDHDEEQGLGDDSNAPNPSPGPGSGSKRRSAPKEERGNEQKEQEKELKEDTSTTATKRKREEKGGAGHRTKVVRKNSSDEAGNAVSPPNPARIISQTAKEGRRGQADMGVGGSNPPLRVSSSRPNPNQIRARRIQRQGARRVLLLANQNGNRLGHLLDEWIGLYRVQICMYY